MSEKTKACNLTEYEIKILINHHGCSGCLEDRIERVNYFHKRLKSFNEVEIKSETNAAGWTNAPASSTGEDM